VKSGLPIDSALAPLRAALDAHRSAVLQAPPGAGKSTVVPLVLAQEAWARGRRLVVLEPRRLAARAVAARMAHTLSEPLGRTVGYRMRLDTKVSRDTRIEVVTEGVLARLLQADPALQGVALVIFDEFHERSLQADLSLALALDARAQLNRELRVLVMSATLDGAAVAQLLGDAPVISAPGRAFAVTTRYLPAGPPLLPAGPGAHAAETPERRMARLILRALREEAGDVLAFLPGAREIRRVQGLLEGADAAAGVTVLPLFGDLAAAEQDAALEPASGGARKVVLATNIAETSLTIPGIRVVVDSGLVRRARFDPATGMGRLQTQRISRASAAQRQGRAGRTAPGVCYRAWGEGAHDALVAFTPPEILEADLTPLALELAVWGTQASELKWLDPPPAAQLSSARDLLARLGALDAHGGISAHGRAMAELALHPRLAHMLLAARDLDLVPLAAQLAALLSERDLLRGALARDADIRTRLEMLSGEDARGADRGTLERARRAARSLARELQPGREARGVPDPGRAGLLLALAYPDRIARRRAGSPGRYVLASGRGAAFAEAQGLARQEFIVAADLEDAGRDARILLAAALSREDLESHFAARLKRTESIAWSPREQAVVARLSVCLDQLVLEEQPLTEVPPERTRAAMLQGVRALGLAALPWDRDCEDLRARVAFVRASAGTEAADWPDLSDAALLEQLEAWLGPWLEGSTRREHLARVPLKDALRGRLSFAQQRALDAWAPTHLTMPAGSHVRVDYSDPLAPAVAVRLQEVFGLTDSPRLGRGAVPVTLRLLSPAQRPLQVTRDLASFWRGAYAQVRKDLRGRYPKHYWPEDPATAQPTRGVRRRS